MNINFLLLLLLLTIYYFIIHENFDNNKNNIYIFYHIYCNDLTLNVLKDQITKIIWSGLYKKVDKIHCFLSGEEKNINLCSDYIKKSGNKFYISDIGIDDKTYERFTLKKIRKYINKNDKLLYIHSKGISKNNTENIVDWRNLMEYFLIHNYDECIKLLDKYDTVGVNKINGYHYSGNFWWTTGTYFLKLPEEIGDSYTAPEDYIFIKDPNSYNLYSSGLESFGHYHNPYPYNKYIDN